MVIRLRRAIVKSKPVRGEIEVAEFMVKRLHPERAGPASKNGLNDVGDNGGEDGYDEAGEEEVEEHYLGSLLFCRERKFIPQARMVAVQKEAKVQVFLFLKATVKRLRCIHGRWTRGRKKGPVERFVARR